MNRKENVSLANYSTMGVGGTAAYLVEAESREEIAENIQWAKTNSLPVLVVGEGSNIVWKDDGFKGLVIVNKITKYEVYKEDEDNYYITIGAGEHWDVVVERTVQNGLTGIECLSLVPGTAGATPVQNVGAYGQEISQTLTTIEAYDIENDKFVIIPASECGFGYRTSRFKTNDKNKFCIVYLTLHLLRGNPGPPFYSSLQNYLMEHGIKSYTPQVIRDAVIAIRSAKLPDPKLVHNTGSFFANPIISGQDFFLLSEKYPVIPHWEQEDKSVKLSAAWLIEQCGLKGVHDEATGMSIWPNQALVLVNDSAKDSASVIKFRDHVINEVRNKFGITLVQEPELLP